MSITFLLLSCEEYTPKPTGYVRIEREEVEYINNDFGAFSFRYPSDVSVKKLDNRDINEIWFNLIYPQYKSVIHCTYLHTSEGQFSKIIEDNYRFVYSHASKAQSVSQEIYSDSLRSAFGVLYHIGGYVATPFQFYITDKKSHFLRGSLYFDHSVNPDSIAPVLSITKNDILNLFESVKWE